MLTLSRQLLSHAEFERRDSILHEKVPEMQLFYADWCGHCTRLKPAWQKASQRGERLAKWTNMDCTNDRELAEKHNVRSFPTIHRVTSANQRIVYKGERTADDIYKFAHTGKH